MPEAEKSIASQIVEMILYNVSMYTMELWYSDDSTPYLSVKFEDNHSEHYSLKKPEAKQYLGRLFYHNTGKAASGIALSDAINTLSGYAMDGEQYQISVRVGRNEGAIYVDLCDRT